MASITVDDNGRPKIITDIAPYVAERDDVVRRLERIYANYEQRSEGALDGDEALIVQLVNRYHQLTDWIDQFANHQKRRANIEAGRALLKHIRGERP